MKVVRYEEIYVPDFLEDAYYNDPEAPHHKKYTGKVIWTHSHFLTWDTVVVACDDGKIRSVKQTKVTVVK